ncbi:capsule biosynthesis protein CapA [Paracoccaceae bacterium GXU_MW_L88]
MAQALAAEGHAVRRIGVNAGDRAYWPKTLPYEAYRDDPAEWGDYLRANLTDTDLMLYGDTRPHHAEAIAIAKAAGATVHVFEEGYLRPSWVTYERDGSNGHSRLMEISINDMRAALAGHPKADGHPQDKWGALIRHSYYGAAYHARVMAGWRDYPNFKPHRGISVAKEARLSLARLIAMPAQRLERNIALDSLRRSGRRYDVVLLQLAHDASLKSHSEYKTVASMMGEVAHAFAAAARRDVDLVFKYHPLEDGREVLPDVARKLAAETGLGPRIHIHPGGKLAALLDGARAVVTVNSTAAQQALWRGLPVRALGRSVYDKPELTSHQPLTDFFAHPQVPDAAAYDIYRNYLLATSQFPGSFYAASGRKQAISRLLRAILSQFSPYERLGS